MSSSVVKQQKSITQSADPIHATEYAMSAACAAGAAAGLE
jgi:hypothetical protein